MDPQPTARTIFQALIVLAIVLLGLALRPFLEALFLAAVLSGALFPVQSWLTRKLRGRRAPAAGLIAFAVIAAGLAPAIGFGWAVIRDVIAAARSVTETLQQDGVTGVVDGLPRALASSIHYILDRLPMEEQELLQEIQSRLADQGARVAGLATSALASTGAFLLDVSMMMIVFFFLLKDGARLVAWLEHVSPLRDGQTSELLAEFRNVSVSVLTSSLATALAQTAVALPGYLIAGVPRPWLFTLATFFMAFIPTIGAGGTCIAAAALLLILGRPWMALLIAVWGVVLVGLSDNLLKPLLVRRGMHLHGAVVFVALVSGLAAFGPIGLLLGPLIVSLLLALIRMYRRDFRTT
jgi:predicted PurR-regulated permease PerM